MNITQLLNGRFDCPRCHDSHGWIRTARAVVRQYSSIHRMRCRHCGEQVVAKVVGGRYSSEEARKHARKEYEALRTLQATFPQDERYGTLVPLAHLEDAAHAIIITRLAAGDELARYIRQVDTAGLQAACSSAGVWLNKLHKSDLQDRKKYLGTAEKVSYLSEKYGTALCRDRKTGSAFNLLAEVGSGIDVAPVVAVRQHGDFKPENMLCDGTRYIGLDIRWQSVGAVVYDLAPFLNHLWLAGRGTGRHKRHLYDLAESAFLGGYGQIGKIQVLRWTQLYFALCYMGEYRQRGRLATSYANWKVAPLVGRLATQLEAVG